jgi:hypothetical protein
LKLRIIEKEWGVNPSPVSASAPGRRGEYEERASCGRAIFGDFGTTFFLKTCSRPEIAKGGNLGERLRRIGAKRSRGRSEQAGTETGEATNINEV